MHWHRKHVDIYDGYLFLNFYIFREGTNYTRFEWAHITRNYAFVVAGTCQGMGEYFDV